MQERRKRKNYEQDSLLKVLKIDIKKKKQLNQQHLQQNTSRQQHLHPTATVFKANGSIQKQLLFSQQQNLVQ